MENSQNSGSDRLRLAGLFTKEDIKHLGISAAALAAGFIVKKSMEKGYQKVYHKDPPDKIEAEEPAWLKLISWTVLTGIVTSAVKNAIRRKGIESEQSHL